MSLPTIKRKSLKSSAFALPTVRKYPVIDHSTAMSALRLAGLQHSRGKLSTDGLKAVHAKAAEYIRKNNYP